MMQCKVFAEKQCVIRAEQVFMSQQLRLYILLLVPLYSTKKDSKSAMPSSE